MFQEKSQPETDQPRTEKKLIITADDFGKSELANRKILMLAEAGKLDRVSVMPDGIFGEEDIGRLITSGVKLDVHLSLSHKLEKRSEARENFCKRAVIFCGSYFRSIMGEPKKVGSVWDRQTVKFVEIVGRRPDGMNSHRYIHFFPAFFVVATNLAKKHKIPRIRFGKIIRAGKNGLTSNILNYFWKKNKGFFSDSGLEGSDFCVSLDWIPDVSNFLSDAPQGSIELICHPEREEEFSAINKYF